MAPRCGSLCGRYHRSKVHLFAGDSSHQAIERGERPAVSNRPRKRRRRRVALTEPRNPARFALQKLTVRRYQVPLGEQSHVRPRTRTIQKTPPLQAAITGPAGRTSTTSRADAQVKRLRGRPALAQVTATAGRVPLGLYLIPLRPFDKGCKTSEYRGKSIPTDRTGVAALQFGHDLEAVEHESLAGFGELQDAGARIFWVALYADVAGAFEFSRKERSATACAAPA
jgi:hypothetical protein